MSDVTKVESAIKKMGYETQSQAGYADRMNTMFTIIKASFNCRRSNSAYCSIHRSCKYNDHVSI